MLHYRIGIGIPSSGMWASEFGISLVALTTYWTGHRAADAATQQFCLVQSEGSILPQIRQRILNKAIKQNCTHLLFLDTDQSFPYYTLHHFLAHKAAVVAANVATKKFPSTTTARRFSAEDPKGIPVYSTPDKTGLERVWRVGCGVMLIDLFYLQRIAQPHFGITWRPEREDFEGEDWFLCRVFEKYDIPIFVDHDISKEVGHVGKYSYDHSVVIPPEEGEDARSGEERELEPGRAN